MNGNPDLYASYIRTQYIEHYCCPYILRGRISILFVYIWVRASLGQSCAQFKYSICPGNRPRAHTQTSMDVYARLIPTEWSTTTTSQRKGLRLIKVWIIYIFRHIKCVCLRYTAWKRKSFAYNLIVYVGRQQKFTKMWFVKYSPIISLFNFP